MFNVVIFTGGETCEPYKAHHWLKSSSIDFIIAADAGFENCLNFQEVPNLIIGDFDSTSKEKVQNFFEKNDDVCQCEGKNFSIQTWPKDKDFTDTELALIEAKNYEEANRASNCFNSKSELYTILVGGDGGRLDHLFGIHNIFTSENYPNVWLGKEQAIICLDSESDFNTLEVTNLTENSMVSVFPVFTKNYDKSKYQVLSENLKWDIGNLLWNENQISLSNRILNSENGKCKLSSKYGRFLVFIPLYAKISWY